MGGLDAVVSAVRRPQDLAVYKRDIDCNLTGNVDTTSSVGNLAGIVQTGFSPANLGGPDPARLAAAAQATQADIEELARVRSELSRGPHDGQGPRRARVLARRPRRRQMARDVGS